MAPSMRGRLRLQATRYRRAFDDMGRGWITWDGVEVASFESIPFLIRQGGVRVGLEGLGQDPIAASDLAQAITNHEGTFAMWQFTDAVEGYPDLTVDRALASDDAIVRGLAMLDRRLGKRRLRSLDLRVDEIDLVRRLYALRCSAEGLIRPS